MSSGGKSFSCSGQPCSALCPTWPNSLTSWSLSMCPGHTRKMSYSIWLLNSEPLATAQRCRPVLLSLGVVKHLGSSRPHLLGLAKAACLCFAGYSKRNWIHMGQIPPTLISHGPGFGTKSLRDVEMLLLLPWGPEYSHQGQRNDKSPAKAAASAFNI